jgi:hypothetical protein
MNQLEEVKGLLDYWTENNNEHARLYMDWAVQVSSAGDEAFSRMLVRISMEQKRIIGLFEEAKSMIG